MFTEKFLEQYLEIMKRDYHSEKMTLEHVKKTWNKVHAILRDYVSEKYANEDPQEQERILGIIERIIEEVNLKELPVTEADLAVDASLKLKPMPTGTAINTIIDVFNASQDGIKGVEALPKQKKKISHTQYSVTHPNPMSPDRGKTTIRHDISKSRGYVAIQIPDVIIGKLTGYSVAVKKFFALVLEKINEQAYQDGQLTREYIEFPIDEVVERGIYGTYQSAQKGLKSAMSCLTNIKMEGALTFNNKTGAISYSRSYSVAVLFPTVGYKNGQCRVYLNEQANWCFVMQAFSILPTYYYSLPNRPSELFHLIFSIARQRTEDIAKRGHFNISFRAIQQALHLPDEGETKNPQRDIKDEILNAVDEIEKTHREYFMNDENMLFLSPEYDDSWPIARFLNEGYLQVSLSGIFAQPFIEIEKGKVKGLSEAKRKRQKALEAKKEQ